MTKPTIALGREKIMSGELSGLNKSELFTWAAYAFHANARGQSYPTRAQIARALGTSEKTISRARKKLIESGLIRQLTALHGERGPRVFEVVGLDTRRDTQDVPSGDEAGETSKVSRLDESRRDISHEPTGHSAIAGGTSEHTRRDTLDVHLRTNKNQSEEPPPNPASSGGREEISTLDQKLRELGIGRATRDELTTQTAPPVTVAIVDQVRAEVVRTGTAKNIAAVVVTRLRSGDFTAPRVSVRDLPAEEIEKLRSEARRLNPDLASTPSGSDAMWSAVSGLYRSRRRGVA